MDFKKWYEEYADMPKKDENGIWYDAETGIAFDVEEARALHEKIKRSEARDKSIESKKPKLTYFAIKCRADAKKIGAKNLKGTTRHVEEAEIIRKKMILDLSKEDAEFLVTHSLTSEAKFYLDNKKESAKSVVSNLRKLSAIREEQSKASLACDEERVNDLDAEYAIVFCSLFKKNVRTKSGLTLLATV